jgi:hypothetical protein
MPPFSRRPDATRRGNLKRCACGGRLQVLVSCICVTLLRHGRSMKVNDLPFRTAFRDHKRDATIRA